MTTKGNRQLIVAAIVLAVSVAAQVGGIDLAAALAPAGAILAWLSGYNTINPDLRDDTEGSDAE